MSTTEAFTFGVLGGTGLYDMPNLQVIEERHISTPFGEPSDAFVLGELEGRRVAFLARHGRGHRLLPSELNFRANIWAFKSLGVERLISLSAVGSMKVEYEPMHILVPDQFIDRTRHRPDTFFGDGLVAHVAFGDPLCCNLAEVFTRAGRAAGATLHEGGTYLCMEGPQFSTRAESHTYRSWGVDVVGMTNLQEAKLAREAEICYATLALVTDYDCWHEEADDVTVEGVVEVLERNADMARTVVAEALRTLPEQRDMSCGCGEALTHALMTQRDLVPEETLKKLAPIISRVWPREVA